MDQIHTKPPRLTIDLTPVLHRQFKIWSTENGASMSDVMRAMIAVTLDNTAMATAVRAELATMTAAPAAVS
jgi:hypothetical protein